ncbi:MarR family winged helix-turn-helix transcriptional regulator [Zhouia amylolytica]|uniref:MarR family transcriptional regulator n=2 Tax=Zhouia amylolytica TaxID=376730 RepID=W2URX1_9FLAO|nr:MarR family transcriptional regulator [Zhouia amylolytica]ETN96910.1 MarR family transcriptional regulator [Zhouia amylolytica AD3]
MSDHTKAVVNLVYTANIISDKITDALKPFDVSTPQFNVLRILRGQKGKPANLSTIQERMIHKMSNTTRLVDKLIDKNFVKRHTCEQNRRKVEIFITNDGLNALIEMDKAVCEAEQQIIVELSKEELNTLNNLLDKLRV